MKNTVITEIVQFTILPGIAEEEFIEIIDASEVNFHKQQKGYIDSELVKGKEERQWFMVMHWDSKENAHEASKLMMQTPITEPFRQSLDPKSVTLLFMEQVRTWML